MDNLDCQGLPMAPALLFVRIKGAWKVMPPKILLVDNDPEYRHMIASIVRRIGYDVIHAKEISEAMEKSASDRPALVMMAEGVEPAGCLKTNRFPVGIPIVVYTAQQTDTCMDEALKNGAAVVLSKPISTADLRVVLRKHLQTSMSRPRPIPSPGFVNESAPIVG
jgi:DNA-binding response OmpR family regulator